MTKKNKPVASEPSDVKNKFAKTDFISNGKLIFFDILNEHLQLLFISLQNLPPNLKCTIYLLYCKCVNVFILN